MLRVRLIHWNAAEAKARANVLRAAGYVVAAEPFTGMDSLRGLRDRLPAAMVIDLGRLPMQGRDVGLAMRHAKATRHVPLVFVDGDPMKVRHVKRSLPDATFTSWKRIRSGVRLALSNVPRDPVVPESVMAGYAQTPLAKKLGIKPGSVVVLAGAPASFSRTLGTLPEGVDLRRQDRGQRDLTLWFTTSRRDLDHRLRRMVSVAEKGGLWIIWPKQSSGVTTDLTQAIVRRTGLAAGLVDFKVCAVDATWTGLRFTRRK